MAIARSRARTRSNRHNLNGRRTRRTGLSVQGLDTSLIPRVVVGAVNAAGIVVVGALRMTRDVLLRTVTGAADISAAALTATTTGARAVVAAASRMVGDIASAAQETLRDATPRPAGARRPRRRVRRLRVAARTARPSVAA